MDLTTTYNLALLFETQQSLQLEEYSQYLNAFLLTPYCLGISSLPHVTLLQFHLPKGDEHHLESYWNQLLPLAKESYTLYFDGFKFLKSGGFYWLSSRVIRTRQLEELQRDTQKIFADCKIQNKMRDQYDPHASLAAWSNLSQFPTISVESGLTGTWEAKVSLSIGQYIECFYSDRRQQNVQVHPPF